MAVSTDPLQRSGVRQLSQETGARYVAPRDNQALAIARALGDIAPGVAQLGDQIAEKRKAHDEAAARRDAVVAKGAELSDATRLGVIRPSQNPWYVSAYKRESAGIRAQDQLSQLATDSQTWDSRNDPKAFAEDWRDHVSDLAKTFVDPDSAKGFLAAEGQATQSALATNQAINSQRIQSERTTNLGILTAYSLIRTIQAQGGKISGEQAYNALAPSREQWFATGGDTEGWNKIVVHAITTASYSIRSPHLIDLLKAPELIQGPGDPTQDRQYGDGSEPEDHAADPLAPLPNTPAATPKAAGLLVSTEKSMRLQPPAMGRITNTFAQHQARGSAGVDIAVPVGTRLTTPVSGIAQVGHDAKSGLFVRVVSDDGKVVSSLAHLNVANVQNGDRVQAGQMVAMSGMTGHTTGPHVHWRVKVDGKDVDPMGYHFSQQATDHQREANAAGEPPAALAPAEQGPPQQQLALSTGPSLYDMPGVADAAESDRYRITSSLDSESSSRIQQIVNERKLKGLEATDRLYATFGSKLLTGDVSTGTIVNTLGKEYAPQVIAEVLNNIHSAVSDTAGLATARLTLNGTDPSKGKALFDLGVEARTKGYSENLEDRLGQAVLRGDISPSDGITIVGEAVSKTHQDKTDAAKPDMGVPGQVIKKYSQIKAGVDAATAIANAAVARLRHGGLMTPGELKVHKQAVNQVILTYLDEHPGDYAGAEQHARDFEAAFIRSLVARYQAPGKPKPQAASSGGNPRR